MKLIDMNELLATVEVDMDVSVTGQENMEAVKQMMQNILEDIKDSPEVEAIPVQWLEQYMQKLSTRTHIGYVWLEIMLKEWKERKEK